MRVVRRIFVHCSATPRDWMQDESVLAQRDELDRWHREERGWSAIGYHIVIGRSGLTAAGRPLESVGAHARGHNEDSVGVCLIGGAGASPDDAPEWHYALRQLETLRMELRRLVVMFPGATVHGHNEVSAKACPGFRVGPWWAAVR